MEKQNFYIKQKESEKLNEEAYIEMAELYFAGKYNEVASASLKVIDEDLTNAFRADYLLLHVFAMGQITEDKSLLEPLINRVIEEKPGTPQAEVAKDLLDILKNGYSENVEISFEPNYIYKRAFSEKHFVIIFVDEEDEEIEDLKSEQVTLLNGGDTVKFTNLTINQSNVVVNTTAKKIGITSKKKEFIRSRIFAN